MAQLKSSIINGTLKVGDGISIDSFVSSLDNSTTHVPTTSAIQNSLKSYFKKYNSEETETVLVASKSVAFSADTEHSSGFYVCAKDAVSPWSDPIAIHRDPIRKLKITWDGTDYICYGQAFSHVEHDDTGVVSNFWDCQLFGNGNNSLVYCYSNETKSMPFMLVQDLWENAGEWLIYAVDGSTASSHTIAITEITGTYNKITPEYQFDRIPDLKTSSTNTNVMNCFNIASDNVSSSLIIGDGNSAIGTIIDSTILGAGNTLSGKYAYTTILGATNTFLRPDNTTYYSIGTTIIGYKNMLNVPNGATTDGSFITGYENTLSSTSAEGSPLAGNAVFGMYNTLTGNILASTVSGRKNKITNSTSNNIGGVAIFGDSNNATNSFAFIAGRGHSSDGYAQTVFGKYSATDANAALKLGWGNSDTDRKNIFQVEQDGTIKNTGGVSLANGDFVINSSGKLTKGDIPENIINFGGDSISGDCSALDACRCSDIRGNCLAGLPDSQFKFEHSTDAGSTWTEFTPANGGKSLCTTTSEDISNGNTNNVKSVDNWLRITINFDGYIYAAITKLLIRIATLGAHGCTCKVEFGDYSDTTVWQEYETVAMEGWSGWNSIPVSGIIGYKDNGNIKYMRLTFGQTSIDTTYSGAYKITKIRLFTRVLWVSPSILAETDLPFKYDENLNIEAVGKLKLGADETGLFLGNNTAIKYRTAGNEALCFESKNPVTSFIFRTYDPTIMNSSWDSVVPSLQIKNQHVAINKLIDNDTQIDYTLEVNGTINANSLYDNGTLLSDKYIHYEDFLLTLNPFGGRKLYNTKIDNIFWALTDRQPVSGTEYNSSGTAVKELSTGELAILFNMNYEDNLKISAGNHTVITIGNSTTIQLPIFYTYPYGDIIVSFYYTGVPASVTGRCYSNYTGVSVGWYDITFENISTESGYAVYKGHIENYMITKIELTITAPTSEVCSLTQIEYYINRPSSLDQFPILFKMGDQKLYGSLTATNFTAGDGDVTNTSQTGNVSVGGNVQITCKNDNYGLMPSANNYNQIGSSSNYWYRSYISNGNFTKCTVTTTPSSGTDVANKDYVDNQNSYVYIDGTKYKMSFSNNTLYYTLA